MHAPALVIFDCDGVLVDSELIACRTDAECLSEIGFSVSADEIAERYVGVSASTMFSDIEARFGRKLPPDFGHLLRERINAVFETELKAVKGIESALDRVPCPKCVASSSDPARIERSLSLTGLLPRFHPYLFSATEVTHGKPAPDLFLHAANRMGADNHACVVVEDSVAGARAGVAAGMRVIGFIGGSHCRPAHEAALRDAGAVAVCVRAGELPNAILDRQAYPPG
jgi:HAD superfamily hydrolase (TIGR01509 family)